MIKIDEGSLNHAALLAGGTTATPTSATITTYDLTTNDVMLRFFNKSEWSLVTGGNYHVRVWQFDLPNKKIRCGSSGIAQASKVGIFATSTRGACAHCGKVKARKHIHTEICLHAIVYLHLWARVYAHMYIHTNNCLHIQCHVRRVWFSKWGICVDINSF